MAIDWSVFTDDELEGILQGDFSRLSDLKLQYYLSQKQAAKTKEEPEPVTTAGDAFTRNLERGATSIPRFLSKYGQKAYEALGGTEDYYDKIWDRKQDVEREAESRIMMNEHMGASLGGMVAGGIVDPTNWMGFGLVGKMFGLGKVAAGVATGATAGAVGGATTATYEELGDTWKTAAGNIAAGAGLGGVVGGVVGKMFGKYITHDAEKKVLDSDDLIKAIESVPAKAADDFSPFDAALREGRSELMGDIPGAEKQAPESSSLWDDALKGTGTPEAPRTPEDLWIPTGETRNGKAVYRPNPYLDDAPGTRQEAPGGVKTDELVPDSLPTSPAPPSPAKAVTGRIGTGVPEHDEILELGQMYGKVEMPELKAKQEELANRWGIPVEDVARRAAIYKYTAAAVTKLGRTELPKTQEEQVDLVSELLRNGTMRNC